MARKRTPERVDDVMLAQQHRRTLQRQGTRAPAMAGIMPGRSFSNSYRDSYGRTQMRPSAGQHGSDYNTTLALMEQQQLGADLTPGQARSRSIHPAPSSSPAVLAQRAKWAQQEATNKMAGQLHGGAYAMGTIASLAKPGQGAGDPTQAGATQTPEAIAGARAAMAKASPVSSSLTGGQFFPDQEMYSDPTSADTGTQSIYKTRIKDFKDEFMRRATGRSSPFSNVEEFKDFVEKNPSYSPEIGTAAWDFAQTQLKSHAPGLYQEIVGQDKVQEANTLSKSQYLDRAMPGVGEGMTADEKEQYVNENLMDDFSKSGIPEWQYNPATKQIEPVPPSPEIAKQAKMEVDLGRTLERLTKKMDRDVQLKENGDISPEEFKRRQDRDMLMETQIEEKLRTANQISLGQTPDETPSAEVQTATNPQTGETLIFQNGQWIPDPAAQPVGQGSITDASGNVIASTDQNRAGTGEGIIIDASGKVVTTPGAAGRQRGQGSITNVGGGVIASTQPTAAPKPTVAKEGRRTELIAQAKKRQYDSSEIVSFIGEGIKSGLLNAGEKAVKQTMEVASLPAKVPLTIAKLEVRLAKKVGKAVASKFVDSITDKMNEKWVDEQLVKE